MLHNVAKTKSAIGNITIWCLGLFCVSASAAFCQVVPAGQNSMPVVRELVKGNTIHFPTPPPVLVDSPIKCDGEGNIFLSYSSNPYAERGGNVLPVTELVLDSNSTVQFQMSPIDGYDAMQRQYFGVDHSGTFYALISAEPRESGPHHPQRRDYFIERFKRDGTRDSLTKLLLPPDSQMQPALFGVFNNGSYLITGMIFRRTTAEPFTALFDSSGRFVKSVSLPSDVSAASETQATPPPPRVGGSNVRGTGIDQRREGSTPPAGQRQGSALPLMAVLHGGLAAAADGNLYLVRSGNPLIVYEISTGGEVVNWARVPIPEAGLSFLELGASPTGLLYFQFGHIASDPSPQGVEPKNMVALFDLTIKRFVALYRLRPDVSQDWLPTCADSRGNFSFVGEGGDHLLEVTTYVEH